MQRTKIPLEVIVRVYEDGKFSPVKVVFDEVEYSIDKIVKITNYKPPDIGCFSTVEYTCKIEGYTKKLYYERNNNQWFAVR